MKNNKTINIAMDDKKVLKDVLTDQSVVVNDKYAKYKTQTPNVNIPKFESRTESVEITYTGTMALVGLLGIFIWSNPTAAMSWYNFMLPIISFITLPNLAILIGLLLVVNKLLDFSKV